MSDSPSRQPVIVGLFVTVGLAVLGGGILAIGNINDTFTQKITVHATFEEVGGLSTGDNVWFSGVKVGVVKGLEFDEQSHVKVEMKIDQDAAKFIRNDALAKIGSDGLIGNKIVVLYEGTPGAPAIADGDVVRIGDEVSMEEMMAMFQTNNENLLAITNDIKTLTSGIVAGKGTAGRLLGDEALATQITETVASMKGTADSASAAAGQMASYTRKLNQPGSLPYELATDKTLFPSLQASATQLQGVATSAGTLVDGLAASTQNPNTPLGTLLHDQEAGGDVKQTLANMTKTTELLNEDLEAVQHNFLLRGYFKKAKEENYTAPSNRVEPEPAAEPKDDDMATPGAR